MSEYLPGKLPIAAITFLAESPVPGSGVGTCVGIPLPTSPITVPAIIANEVFASIGDVGQQQREPLYGGQELTISSGMKLDARSAPVGLATGKWRVKVAFQAGMKF